MFSTIFKFELAHWLRQPAIYVYAIVFLLLATGAMAADLGIFDGASSGQYIGNAPLSIYRMITFFQELMLFLLPAVMGNAIYRDFKYQVHRVLFAYPFTKIQYVAAKFLSSLLVVLALSSLIVVGIFLGTQLPGIPTGTTVSFVGAPYWHTYLIYILPNMLCWGALVFVVVSLSRNSYAGFITVIVLILLGEILGRVLSNSDTQFLGVLLDPLGEQGMAYYTRYWTVDERNAQALPLSGGIILNRLLWLGLSAIFLIWGYTRFTLSERPLSWRWGKKPAAKMTFAVPSKTIRLALPKVRCQFSRWHQLKTAWQLSNFDFLFILRSWSFISIVLAGLLFVVFSLLQMNPQFEMKILPVTWVMLKFPLLFFSLIIVGLTFLYAGMLIHRAKMAKMDQLVDTTPMPNWVFLCSKFLALVKMQMALLSLLMIGGMAVQTYQGYYQYEIAHYIFDLYALHLIYFVLWAFVAVFVQTIFTNPYLGLFFLLLTAGGISILPDIGIEHPVFRFNQDPNPDWLYAYSDLDGHGSGMGMYFAYKTYWLLGGLLLYLAAFLFWSRGLSLTFQERLRIAKQRLKGRAVLSLIVLLMAFSGLGLGLYRMDKETLSNEEQELWMVHNEQIYKQYENTVQPRITGVKVNVDIFPETHSFKVAGSYSLSNRSQQPIDTLLLHYAFNEVTEYRLLPKYEVISRDTVHRIDVLKLREKLLPGDSLTLFFNIKNDQGNSKVKSNGTYFDNSIFPGLGYRAVELTDNAKREKYGLPRRAIDKPFPSDSAALYHSYSGHDADWIDFEAIVSTSGDQIAIAPGYLQKEWREGNRRYFHYKMDHKIKNYFGFNSGRFAVKKDRWKNVDLEIYYHPTHTHNLQSMINGLKGTLAYNTKYFSPYQHQQARIIEFPNSLGSFATTFANSIPFSELRFIADVETGAIDFPFYVAAHEMAHQWWGNQLLPADVLGAKMLTESLSEYTALKVLEKQYGKDQMRKFLKFDLDLYLRGRGRENKAEMPLIHTYPHQNYISYRKGALAFYALSDYLGEEKLNQTIQSYLKKVQFQEAPYTTSLELMHHLRQAAPDSLQYLITDLFETITLYDNRIEKAAATPLEDGQYRVDLQFVISKYHSGEQGKRVYNNKGKSGLINDKNRSLPLNDYIEIGIFGSQGNILYLQKQKITKIDNQLSFVVNQKPAEVGVDPYHKLIDVNTGDNRLTTNQ